MLQRAEVSFSGGDTRAVCEAQLQMPMTAQLHGFAAWAKREETGMGGGVGRGGVGGCGGLDGDGGCQRLGYLDPKDPPIEKGSSPHMFGAISHKEKHEGFS